MLCAYDGISKEFGTMIKEDADKLNDLCNSFLDFARPLNIREEDVELKPLFERIANHHRFAANGKGVAVHVKGEQLILKGDSRRIEQVAHNLVLNAIQACQPGDNVTINVSHLGFQISDTGCGMNIEQLGKLFTPFFTTKSNGTGLGLSNVRKIIDAHGGEIRVKSEVGHGTTFEIEFDDRRIA
jgi:signal transduction histidine kinase